MSGSYRLSAPLSPLQETNGRHGSQARNVSPVRLAKLHISRAGPERRLLRRLAGPGPNCYGATSRREEVWAWATARSHPQPNYQTKFAIGTSAASNCSTSTWRARNGIIGLRLLPAHLLRADARDDRGV